MGKKIIINGKFMSQTVTGVQRYAREILLELDKIITKDDNIEIAVNSDAKNIPEYKNISIKKVDRFTGNIWEQISLPFYAMKNKAEIINLCNSFPLLYPGIVCIFDMKIKKHPEFFNKKFIIWYNILFYNAVRRSKLLLTDSEFAKNEIINYYSKVDSERIKVIYAAWQHFSRISYDENVFKKYNLSKDKFYFSMSSLDPNKNFNWIAEAAKKNPEILFVVSGAVNKKVFGDIFDFEVPDNLKFLGYVSDEEAKTLMRDCKAFLFPTFYEGFGIPPLEALSAGTQCLVVSDIPAMREIFEDAVTYIDPNSYQPDQINCRITTESERQHILGKYKWSNSAKNLWNVLKSSQIKDELK